MRVGDDVKFNLISDCELLETELNKKMDEKVSQSKILTQWIYNQKNGYKNIKKESYYLFISMDSLSLMTLDEQVKVLYVQNEKKYKLK